MKIAITRLSPETLDVPLPMYTTAEAAGMDVRAAVEQDLTVRPKETVLVPTGFAMAIPPGFEAQIRPRSGLAIKHQVGILNAPGTIDADYRGEVRIIVTNFGDADFLIKRGDRIAQMVIAPYVKAEWEERESLDATDRGAGGFGHTGR
jgi:dUTP pyrophosphatase